MTGKFVLRHKNVALKKWYMVIEYIKHDCIGLTSTDMTETLTWTSDGVDLQQARHLQHSVHIRLKWRPDQGLLIIADKLPGYTSSIVCS